MGKTASSTTACCSMAGVICSGSIVKSIVWNRMSLTASQLPSSFGNLKNLEVMYENVITDLKKP
jgi:hypothetical protein